MTLLLRMASASYTKRATERAKAFPARFGLAYVPFDELDPTSQAREVEAIRAALGVARELAPEVTRAMIWRWYELEDATDTGARRAMAGTANAMIDAILTEGEG